MWLYPYLTWFTIAAIGVVIASMAFVDDVRSQLCWGWLSVAVVLVAYFVKAQWARTRAATPAWVASPVRQRRFSAREDRERDRRPTRSSSATWCSMPSRHPPLKKIVKWRARRSARSPTAAAR